MPGSSNSELLNYKLKIPLLHFVPFVSIDHPSRRRDNILAGVMGTNHQRVATLLHLEDKGIMLGSFESNWYFE